MFHQEAPYFKIFMKTMTTLIANYLKKEIYLFLSYAFKTPPSGVKIESLLL